MATLEPGNGEPQFPRADYGFGTERPVQADIPPYLQTDRRRNGGILAAILASLGFALKFKALWFTVASIGVTAFLYAQLFGWAFGVGIVLLILVHESGHLVVARLMGFRATLPILIP